MCFVFLCITLLQCNQLCVCVSFSLTLRDKMSKVLQKCADFECFELILRHLKVELFYCASTVKTLIYNSKNYRCVHTKTFTCKRKKHGFQTNITNECNQRKTRVARHSPIKRRSFSSQRPLSFKIQNNIKKMNCSDQHIYKNTNDSNESQRLIRCFPRETRALRY